MIKKILCSVMFLAAFTVTAAKPLYFGNPNGYTAYHPYEWNEIQIVEFRGQREKPVADWVKKAGYPLIHAGGPNNEKNPYIEVDTNGHKIHKYRRYVYEPRIDLNGTDKWVDANDDGVYEAPKKTKGKPLIIKSGMHKGKRLDKLVVVYEKLPDRTEWVCYDAYWVWSTKVTRKRVRESVKRRFENGPAGMGLERGHEKIPAGRLPSTTPPWARFGR